MVYKVADNIFSPLGETTEANYEAVRRGESRLRLHEGKFGVPEPFMASLFDGEVRKAAAEEGVPFFEYIAVESIRRAVEKSSIDVSGENVVLILSTTKCDVAELEGLELSSNESIEDIDDDGHGMRYYYPGAAAKRIAERVGVRTMPIVVCNACVSGLSAIILAQRLLNQGSYDYAIVCGADVICRFIISGFQSLKIMSTEPCRPFDIERNGLNLGEAAATIILAVDPDRHSDIWAVESGAVRNDAMHISTPSAKGDGLYMALSRVLSYQNPDDFTLVNAHGTGTLFNDRMEAAAICRAGLESVPVNALKGVFGHTMGACGVLETVLTMRALDDDVILGSRGFAELGVSSAVNISAEERVAADCNVRTSLPNGCDINHSVPSWPRIIKTLSGFGGSNAAIVASRMPLLPVYKCPPVEGNVRDSYSNAHVTDGRVLITPSGATMYYFKDIETEGKGDDLIVNLYRRYVGDWPRFYKMDGLSRLGFVASELLLRAEAEEFETDRFSERDDRDVIFFNTCSSVLTDRKYIETIRKDEYYPSPSVFLYTLPNIVTGEIAIRNHYHGETAFYILPERDERQIGNILATVNGSSVLTGWLEYEDSDHFYADIRLLTFACT